DNNPGRYPGWMGVEVELLPGKDRADVEKLTLAEIQKLRDKPIDANELKRVKQLLLSAAVFKREGTYGLADSIGQAVTPADRAVRASRLGAWDSGKRSLPGVRAAPAEDVKRVAKKSLDPEKWVPIWSVPKKKKGKDEEVRLSQPAAPFRDASKKRSSARLAR